MRRLGWVLALWVVAGCRRHHEPPAVEPEPVAPTATAAAPASGEPVAPPAPAATAAPATTATAATGPRLPDGGTINGDPRGPRAVDFNRVVDSSLVRLRQCFDAAGLPPGESNVVVHYIVEPPGYTGGVTVRGTAPAAVQSCARNVVVDLKFPEFRGHKVEGDLPFTYKKTETPTAADAAAAPTP